jgi:Sulfatase
VIADDPPRLFPDSRAKGLQLRRLLLDAVALLLILLAPFVVVLGFNGYAYFTPEVLAIFSGALALAMLLALLLRFAGEILRAALFAVLIAMFIDVQLDVPPAWSSLSITLLFLAAVVVLGAILWFLREHAPAILCVVFLTLLGLTLVRGDSGSNQLVSEQAPATAGESAAPLLIHLLLDEHIGAEGLPQEIVSARELRARLVDFYTSNGFRLFGGAYSQYANTYNSIANLMNFAARETSHPYLQPGAAEAEWNLEQSAYFRMLQQRGYRLHVYQSSYMDLCHVKQVQLEACTTYPVARLGLLQDLALPTIEKSRAIGNAIVTQSAALRVLNKVYERVVRKALMRVGWHAPAWGWQPPSFGPLRVPAVFDRLTEDVLRHPRGHAFFAHLILPHYPYVFDERCTLRSRTSDWLTNRISATDPFIYNTPSSRAQKYERYVQQVGCVLTKLDDMLTQLERRGLLDDAIVIVNGDHGSRLPEHFPSGMALAAGRLDDADYRDTFSTLFAIRSPGVSPGYDAQPAPLRDLLNHHLAGEPLHLQSSCRVFLLEEDGQGTLTAVEPSFCAVNLPP